jgi:hypothetical protein
MVVWRTQRPSIYSGDGTRRGATNSSLRMREDTDRVRSGEQVDGADTILAATSSDCGEDIQDRLCRSRHRLPTPHDQVHHTGLRIRKPQVHESDHLGDLLAQRFCVAQVNAEFSSIGLAVMTMSPSPERMAASWSLIREA